MTYDHHFSFRLKDLFIDDFAERRVDWGYEDYAGNSLGEITFLRTYSRVKPDGTKERWFEVCRRVIEGMFSILKDHAVLQQLPWDEEQAHSNAQEAYERMFSFKWLPPGRGLWMMGTQYVMQERNSAALQNCAFVSTAGVDRDNPAEPFAFLMEASMLGIGVGFDTHMGRDGLVLHQPGQRTETFVVPDSREGWVEATTKLVNSYLKPGQASVEMDYSLVRAAGEPIKGFGGTASGPGPLRDLHERVTTLFAGRAGETVSTVDVVDLMNLIGCCVVAGNVRRSAELALGQPDDADFVLLKDPEAFPTRNSFDPEKPGWGWMSNNSLEAHVGMDYTPFLDAVKRNGEPGFIWLDVTRKQGRLIDPVDNRDHRAAGFNPCVEMPLESFELCTLVEAFLNRAESKEDFKRTLKFAYLYAKAVTLVPTGWEKSNAVMQRNRRIGTSISGIAEFADTHGLPTLREWMDEGYAEVRYWDASYSEWLCVRDSIRVTTVKPSGSVSILAGATPGVHWAPGGKQYLRTIRFGAGDPMVDAFRAAGYRIEDDVVSDNTVVVYFPVVTSQKRSERDVSIFEKANLAVQAQRYWSDNGVSVTVSFDREEEADYVGTTLAMHEGNLKAVSFLPMGNDEFPQMPYTQASLEDVKEYGRGLFLVDLSSIYDGGNARDAEGERYCTTDKCELPGNVIAEKDNGH
ncbi:MAG: fused protease/ribonucleoside-triphosphate reductase [Actinomycetia bacterium]|nr:fused protease/ribonucleoside-triphosphate reductase [Actinomycetes bacterium]